MEPRVNKQLTCHLTTPTARFDPSPTLQRASNCDNVDGKQTRACAHISCCAVCAHQTRTKLFCSQTQTSSFAAVRNPHRQFCNLFSSLVFGGDPQVTRADDDIDRRLDAELTDKKFSLSTKLLYFQTSPALKRRRKLRLGEKLLAAF